MNITGQSPNHNKRKALILINHLVYFLSCLETFDIDLCQIYIKKLREREREGEGERERESHHTIRQFDHNSIKRMMKAQDALFVRCLGKKPWDKQFFNQEKLHCLGIGMRFYIQTQIIIIIVKHNFNFIKKLLHLNFILQYFSHLAASSSLNYKRQKSSFATTRHSLDLRFTRWDGT